MVFPCIRTGHTGSAADKTYLSLLSFCLNIVLPYTRSPDNQEYNNQWSRASFRRCPASVIPFHQTTHSGWRRSSSSRRTRPKHSHESRGPLSRSFIHHVECYKINPPVSSNTHHMTLYNPGHVAIPIISHRSPVPILKRWRLTNL